MNNRKEQTYIAPEMEVVYIEIEQAILDASSEDIDDIFPDGAWDKN